MNKKTILLSISSIAAIAIIYFSVSYFQKEGIRSELPTLPDLSSYPEPLSTQLKSAHNNARKTPNASSLGNLGKVYYASNYYEEAIRCFTLAADLDSTQWQWNYYLGSVLTELGESDKALKNMQKVTAAAPNVHLAWYRQAEICQQLGMNEEAYKILEKIENLDLSKTQVKTARRSTYFPLQILAKLLEARALLNDKQTKKAEDELLLLTKKYKTFGPAFKLLSILYAQQGDTELANKYADRSGDLVTYVSPVDTLMDQLALLSRSEDYLLKQVDNAIRGSDPRWTSELLKNALENLPGNKFILSKTIKQYMRMGVGKYALPYLDEHFSYFKDTYQELLETGTEIANAGFAKDAARYLLRAKDLPGQSPEKTATLAGLIYEKAHLKKEGLDLMQSVSTEAPTDELVLKDAIFLYLEAGETIKAQQLMSTLRKLSPANTNLLIFEGILAAQNGKKEQTAVYYQKAFDKDPANRFLINQLGRIYLESKQWTKLINLYRKALQATPNDSEFQMQLGMLLVTCPDNTLHKIDEGTEYSERAFYNSIFTPEIKISAGRTLAWANYQLGDKNLAKYYIDETIRLALKSNAAPSYIQNLQSLSEQISN